jgi:hypothetical protein
MVDIVRNAIPQEVIWPLHLLLSDDEFRETLAGCPDELVCQALDLVCLFTEAGKGWACSSYRQAVEILYRQMDRHGYIEHE